ncbi:MAG: NADH-quinone oxidoreductase subunit J [Burkholderiales bacterium]|nr:NADH-quinone oxidoreductase subunit J [Burkholderiales bacterium]
MIEATLQYADTALLVLFGVFALAGAVAMLVLRHPMRVAMALIGTMISLGGIYGLLGVHFIAAFQVLIYVSAVMVFIVYVIMLLDVRDLSFTHRFTRLVVPAAAAGLLFFVVLGHAVWRDTGGVQPATALFGIGQFAVDFLSRYWLQFEVTSVLLVAAVVAAIVVVRLDDKDHG